LLKSHRSLGGLLSAVYPNFPWQLNTFADQPQRSPNGYWSTRTNLLQEIIRAESALGITSVTYLTKCTTESSSVDLARRLVLYISGGCNGVGIT